MNVDDFQTGRLIWQQANGLMPADLLKRAEFLQKSWQDGVVTFSVDELRLKNIGTEKLQEYLGGRSDQNGGPEGYLMELNCWRKADQNYEELALERQGETFSAQYLKLLTNASDETGMLCYYRTAQTVVRNNIEALDHELTSIEVVVPEYRLRFYLTRGAA